MNISNSLSRMINSINLSNPEHIVIQTIMYPINPPVKLFCKVLNITIAYPNLGLNSSYLTVLVPMSDSFRPPPHTTLSYEYCTIHHFLQN